jgi:hypothetical protein
MSRQLTLLGVAEAARAPALEAALAAQPGPALRLCQVGGLLGVAQVAARSAFPAGRAAMFKRLHAVQRRLEIACQTGPFLPADPAAAQCPAGEFAALIEAAAPALGAALAREGGRHQWQVTLRWAPEDILAVRRDAVRRLAASERPKDVADAVAAILAEARAERAAALRAALLPLVAALSPEDVSGGEGETSLTILVPAGGEAAIEAGLGAMPPALTQGMSCDLTGPLPPLSFSAFRVVEEEAGRLDGAWRLLGLPARADGRTLARRWREVAGALHPDRAGGNAPGFAAASEAHRLLRGALPADGQDLALQDLATRAGRRIILPELAA